MMKKGDIADYFKKEANPYSQKRAVNGFRVGAGLAILTIVFLAIGAYFDARAEKQAVSRSASQATRDDVEQAKAQGTAQSSSGGNSDKGFLDLHIGGGASSPGASRQHSASQIIKRGDSSGDLLPSGTQVRVRLVGRAESADSETPVAAIVTDPAVSPVGAELIPVGAKLIGQGRLDASRERLQVQFHTIVFPDGEQFSVSALAQMPDGTSGLDGKFSSGAFKRHASEFIGNFVGGVAEGLEDRTTGAGLGIPFEPGSVKNGLLNGAAQSSLNYAKSTTDSSGQSQATITVESGVAFFAYLSQGFHQ